MLTLPAIYLPDAHSNPIQNASLQMPVVNFYALKSREEPLIGLPPIDL